MIDFSIPLSGMNAASASLDRAAVKLAASAAPSPDTVNLSDAVVQMLQAHNDFSVNIKAAQTMDEMQKSALDVLG